METYLFIGSVLPDSNLINSRRITVELEDLADAPSSTITAQVLNNRVVGSVVTSTVLSNAGCATMRNVVQDVASSLCDGAAIIEGAWTVVTIDTCVNSDGSIRMRFSNASSRLKGAFQNVSVNTEDIVAINLHPEGFHLRLALDDVNSGLMEGKFMRSHFYRAAESLRNSVAPQNKYPRRSECWEVFRETLGIQSTHIVLSAYQPERHADYANAMPMSSQETDCLLDGIADMIARYIRWFNADKLS